GLPRFHDSAAPDGRRGDPHPQGADRRAQRAAARGRAGVYGAREPLMAKPRELRRRIRSIQNTRKITKTMELVSTSKLKRAQDRVFGARPYATSLADELCGMYD